MTGDELKALRLAASLSRPALARLAGLHPDSVKYWEAKPYVCPRGHAPRLILTALNRTDLLHVARPARQARKRGNFRSLLRARDGVLSGQGNLSAPKRCGAKTRKGTPCRAKPLPGKRRCKFHGGMSTGPKTPEGKAQISKSQRKRWQKAKNTCCPQKSGVSQLPET